MHHFYLHFSTGETWWREVKTKVLAKDTVTNPKTPAPVLGTEK